jgi:hypothetical protein
LEKGRWETIRENGKVYKGRAGQRHTVEDGGLKTPQTGAKNNTGNGGKGANETEKKP